MWHSMRSMQSRRGGRMSYEPPLEDDIALGKDEEEIEDDELDRMLGDE